MKSMISVNEGLKCIQDAVQALEFRELSLDIATGLILSQDVFSPVDIPAYPQSSMDGYAFAFEEGKFHYEIEGEMAAGSSNQILLPQGKAIRIFTGAPVPSGADTVLMQEKAMVEDGVLHIQHGNLCAGDHVRLVGSEIAKGTKALLKGDPLTPARIGFLAGMGIATVSVIPLPRVSILVTGNELQEIGKSLLYGQVYDSNSLMLRACLEKLGVSDITILKSGDDPAALTQSLNQMLDSSDLILITGGVSVGDYDFTSQVLEAVGITRIFHKIKQKPGKPLLFGMKGNSVVFGLPGNPASVLTCFYQYVLPALGKMMGRDLSLPKTKAMLMHDHKKPAGLTHFLKAVCNNQQVTLVSGQESYKLSSFATANCFVVLPEEVTSVANGEWVDIHLIPN